MAIAILPSNGVGHRPSYYDEYGQEYYYDANGKKHYAEEANFHIGANSNGGVNAEVNGFGINQNGPYINSNNLTIGTGGQTYNSQPQSNKPVAYKANAAGTASSIKQGGMTKDEIMDFNIRHPNETMIRGQ